MKKKIVLISVVALMGAVSIMSTVTSAHTVQAADTTITKTIMHTSLAYNKDGKSTGIKYYAYKTVNVMTKPVEINDDLYYKVNGLNHYLKATNIDCVTRRITHNTIHIFINPLTAVPHSTVNGNFTKVQLSPHMVDRTSLRTVNTTLE